MRGGRGFRGVVVAHERQHAAVLRGSGEIGVTKHVAGAVDARSLAVPHRKHAIEFALAAQFGLLRAPHRGGGQVFVEAGLEADVGGLEMALGAHELLIEAAERRAAVAGDEARGIEPGAAVALLLHHAEADQRLETGDEDAAVAEIELVVEADWVQRHWVLSPRRKGLAMCRLQTSGKIAARRFRIKRK